MYWPVGAPRIYAAKLPVPSIPPPSYDSRNPSTSSARASTDSTGDPIPPAAASVDESSEDENRKVGEQEVVDEDEDAKAPPPPTPEQHQDASHIIALKVARNGSLFATVTSAELTIWQTKPTAVVAHVRRSEQSRESYGPNVDILIRPDSQIFVVQTELGYLMTYSLATDPNATVYRPHLVNAGHHARQQSLSAMGRTAVGPSGIALGTGEAGGVREYSLQFRMVIKVDAGIQKVLALEDELMVATIKPAAIQCIRWTPDAAGSQTSAELLSRMPWMQKKVITTDMVYDRPMNLSTWVTSDGRAYAVQKTHISEDGKPGTFKGYCFHVPQNKQEGAVKLGINARFSVIAVACESGSILVYNARDYNGNIPLSHKLQVPTHNAGAVTFVAWSPDGYCLFVGYEAGWATWSVYGKPGSNSFQINRSAVERQPNEEYLLGVKEGSWIANGGDILLLQNNGDERIWNLEFAKSAVTGCFSCVNTARPLLQTNSQLFIYRGYDQDDITMISQDTSALWHTVQMPAVYLAQNWPIRMAVSSPDGRYVAIAGTRGLAHYSVNSGRWRTFASEQQEQDFVVRGGMCWYQHVLIAAIESGDTFELRLYSRELQLDNGLILHSEDLPAAVIFMSLTGDDSLLVYTYDNILYHFIIQSTETSVRLVQVGQITFHGIIRAPARVRSISWLLPDEQVRDGEPSRDVAVATVIFLVDGKLVQLQPSTTEGGDLKYDMRVLHQNVEYYLLMRDQPPLKPPALAAPPLTFPENLKFPAALPDQPLDDSLWLFDGAAVKVFPDALTTLHSPPVTIPVDFYPLSILLHKAIILGLEPSIITRNSLPFTYHKFQTRTHLLLHHLLRHLLTTHQAQTASALAAAYSHLPYFPHALEILLHSVLDDEADTPPPEDGAMLPDVIRFLAGFPEQYLDVVVQCTRKTEVASWRHLFDVVGSPQALFEESLERGLLKTAGGYLLVLQTLEKLEEGGREVGVLLRMARERGEWGLCMELARFLVAVDNGGDTLRSVLGEVGVLEGGS